MRTKTDLAIWWAVGAEECPDCLLLTLVPPCDCMKGCSEAVEKENARGQGDPCAECGQVSTELEGLPSRYDADLIDLLCPKCHTRRSDEQ